MLMTFTELTPDLQFRVYIHDVKESKDLALLEGAQAILCDATTESDKNENKQKRKYLVLADPLFSDYVANQKG